MRGDELRALARAVLGMLQAALPFQDRPAGVVVAGEPGEDAAEVDVAVAERAEPPGAAQPGLEARVHALPGAGVELGVLDVERLDPLVVDVDEAEVVELLQQEMAGVVVDAAARMIADPLEEHLEGGAVDQVLARVDLVAEVDAVLLEDVEDRLPAPGQLVEGGLDQPGRARRPGIDVGPGERAREADVGIEAEAARGLCRVAHLLHRPPLTRLGLPRTAGAANASKPAS